MGRAYSKAAKRRNKKALPAIAPIKRRAKQGRARMPELERENLQSNLEARARQMGSTDIDAMRKQMLGEGAGQALHLLCKPDIASRLWDHYTALTAAEARYHRSLGKSIHAKTAKIEAMREAFEVSAESTIDLRSEEDRDRDAVRKWMHWQGNIMRIHGQLQSAIYNAYRQHATLVIDGKATKAGKLFVEAMVEMDKMI